MSGNFYLSSVNGHAGKRFAGKNTELHASLEYSHNCDHGSQGRYSCSKLEQTGASLNVNESSEATKGHK